MRRILLVLAQTAREKVEEVSRCFKESKPGRRFEDHYHGHQESSSGRCGLRVTFCVFGGSLIVVGGIIAVPGPDPGWLIILLGLWMLAGELLFFARSMDKVEVKLRRVARGVVGIWTILVCLSEGLNHLDDPRLRCGVKLRNCYLVCVI